MSDQEFECLGESAGVPPDFNFLQELELFEIHTGRKPPPPPEEKSKVSGRPLSWESKVLNLFQTRRGALKKEYLRCKLIRGHKKTLRKINKAVLTNKALPNSEHAAIWQAMAQLFNEEPAIFRRRSQICSGPCTDSRRKGFPPVTFKSFNEDFCQAYFKPVLVRRSFVLYLDLVFQDCSPGPLVKHFQFSCCESNDHVPDCVALWQTLKVMVQQKLIRDVDLTVYAEATVN